MKFTVGTLLDKCLANHWFNKSPLAFKRLKWALNPIRSFFQDKIASEVKAKDIIAYQKLRLKTVSTATVNRELTLLRAAYFWAIDIEETLQENPVSKISFFEEKSRARIVWYDTREKQSILHSLSGIYQAIVLFAIKTGMRLGQMINLKWDDVNLNNGTVKTISYKGKKVTVNHVPLFSEARDVLEALPRIGALVFCHGDGRPLSHSRVYRNLMIACKASGVVGKRFHDLRHTFASDFLSKGGSISELAKVMGHSTTAMTERYGHLSKEHLVSAIQILPKERVILDISNKSNGGAGTEIVGEVGHELVTLGS